MTQPRDEYTPVELDKDAIDEIANWHFPAPYAKPIADLIFTLRQREKELEGDCPNCDNVGWFPYQVGEEEYEQVQCQWCEMVPYSKFNRNRFADLTRQLSDSQAVMELKDIEKNNLRSDRNDAYEAISKKWEGKDLFGFAYCLFCQESLTMPHFHPQPSDCIVMKARAGR